GAQHGLHLRAVVVRQAARVGAGIGEELVHLVEALGGRERAAGGPAEAADRLALEAGQVEQRRRRLARGLARLLGGPGAPLHRLGDAPGSGLVEDPIVAGLLVAALRERGVEPGALVAVP